MRKLLLATVALMLVMPASATTDYCAVVKKTPDGFLALRAQPTVKSYLWTKLRPGTVLVIDDTSEDQCEKNGPIKVCPTDGWSFVHTIPELDDGKPTPTQGWVATRYTRPVPCPSSISHRYGSSGGGGAQARSAWPRDARGGDGGVREVLARGLKMKNPDAPAVKREAEEEWR